MFVIFFFSEVTKILLFTAQASHEMLPPEVSVFLILFNSFKRNMIEALPISMKKIPIKMYMYYPFSELLYINWRGVV